MNNPLKNLQDQVSRDLYGITKDEAIQNGICIKCKQSPVPRCPTDADKKEYFISGLCGVCFKEETEGEV